MSKKLQLECRSTKATVHTEVVGVFQDSNKKIVLPKGAYGAVLRKLSRDGAFTGKSNSCQLVPLGGKSKANHVLFVGLGAAEKGSGKEMGEACRLAGGQVYGRLVASKAKSARVSLEYLVPPKSKEKEQAVCIASGIAEGIALAAYRYDRHKSKKKSDSANEGLSKITFFAKDRKSQTQFNTELARVRPITDAVAVTRDWSNEPSNTGTPTYFANEARKLAKAYGIKCKVMGPRELQKERMGLLLGVGQGSEEESRVVVLDYKPRGAKKTLALVGKGVTFDSGGISIKPSMRMEEMKHDMTGAATVMGAALLAAKWKVPTRIITVMGFAENMPSGRAIQPGNVIKGRSGKTVEVINTDAEGRLVLADLLDYVQTFKPDAIIDAATLTGAVGIALGKQCCAVLGNEEDLIERINDVAKETGERVWQLPLYDEYTDDLRSDVADLKNVNNSRLAGTILGGAFLKEFVKKGTPWAHLDIAYMAWDLATKSYYPKKGASGAYVRLLARLAAEF